LLWLVITVSTNRFQNKILFQKHVFVDQVDLHGDGEHGRADHEDHELRSEVGGRRQGLPLLGGLENESTFCQNF
jgi:hypothetical protein